MSIFNEILISTKYKYSKNSENQKANHMVAWYSRQVISTRQAQTAQIQPEQRVALSSPITRAYISHGWNCKHCRNCQYACPGVFLDIPANTASNHDIRGPCKGIDTLTMNGGNKSEIEKAVGL